MWTQALLREGRGLECLKADFGVEARTHPTEPLVILNYSQTESPKAHPVVRECRGLTLCTEDWSAAARGMPRFFNLGECPEDDARFEWHDCECWEKCDGSLMLLYRWRDGWWVNTRGSFASAPIAAGCPLTWEEAFWSLADEVGADELPHHFTYVFELCTPYNRVVRHYPESRLYLLTAVETASGKEAGASVCDWFAGQIGARRPERYKVRQRGDVEDLVRNARDTDATFEGFVVRDRSGLRLKVKNPKYVELHHLKANGLGFREKNLLPFALHGGADELLTYFPECRQVFGELSGKLQGELARLEALWGEAQAIESQKDFALYVLPRSPLAHLLFQVRKTGEPVAQVFRRSEQVLLKWLENDGRGERHRIAA
jgi:hypothetical protein